MLLAVEVCSGVVRIRASLWVASSTPTVLKGTLRNTFGSQASTARPCREGPLVISVMKAGHVVRRPGPF